MFGSGQEYRSVDDVHMRNLLISLPETGRFPCVDIDLMRKLDEPHLRLPFRGSRLLRDYLRVNQVWCGNLTYTPIRKEFLHLVAIMDWHSRKVLSWRLSNSLIAAPCIEVPEEALATDGTPEIFNSDQNCRFTSEDFTDVLKDNGIKISMDGKGRWMDNVFIERL